MCNGLNNDKGNDEDWFSPLCAADKSKRNKERRDPRRFPGDGRGKTYIGHGDQCGDPREREEAREGE